MAALTIPKELTDLIQSLSAQGAGLTTKVNEVLAWGADKGRLDTVEKAIIQLEKAFKELPASFEKSMGQIRQNTWGNNNRYRGVFSSETSARAFGLMVLGTVGGNESCMEMLKKEFSDLHGAVTAKAQTTTPSAGGGLLVPTEFSARIVSLVEEYGVFAGKAFSMPMGSTDLSFTEETDEPEVFAVGEGQPDETAAKWANIGLTAKDWGSLVFYPKNLEDDMIVSIAEYIARRLARAHAYKADLVGFTGDGLKASFGIKGILPKLAEINGVDDGGGLVLGSSHLWSALVIDDFSNVQGSLPQYASAGAQWYMHRAFFFKVLKKLVLKSGGVTATEVEGKRKLAFDGEIVNITQVMPKVTAVSTIPALYGDLSLSSTIGIRKRWTIEQSRDYKFAQRQVALLGYSRTAINNHNLGTATDAGPVVGLLTKAS